MRILRIMFVFVLIVFITGCGEVNLDCSKISDDKTEKIIATAKGNKILKIVMEESKYFDDLDEMSSEYDDARSTLFLYKLVKGVEANVTKNGNTLKQYISIDLNKGGGAIIRDFFDLVEFTPSAFIEYADSEGYVCK